LAISSQNEPQNYEKDCKHHKWIIAIGREIKALQSSQIWHLSILACDKKPIGCEWV